MFNSSFFREAEKILSVVIKFLSWLAIQWFLFIHLFVLLLTYSGLYSLMSVIKRSERSFSVILSFFLYTTIIFL